MKNFEKDGFVVPYINLNGNSRRQIMDQLSDIDDLLYKTRIAFMKLDMYDGRNGANSEHRKALKDDRDKYFSKIDEVYTYVNNIMMEIQE